MDAADARRELVEKVKRQMEKVKRGELPLNQAAAEIGLMPFEMAALFAQAVRPRE